MRRLLAAGVLAVLILGVGASESRAAYPYDTWFLLKHPTGSGTSLTARLECGWHDNCDTFIGDPLVGLDWTWTSGSHSVRFRAETLVYSEFNNVRVAVADSETYGGFCPRVDIKIQRTIDSVLFGTVSDAHTSGGWSGLLDIYGGPGWTRTDVYVGQMVDPALDDCNGLPWHTMQSFFPGYLPYSVTRNTNYPTEEYCNWTNYNQDGTQPDL